MKRVGLRKRLSHLFAKKQRHDRGPGARQGTRTKASSARPRQGASAPEPRMNGLSMSPHAVMVDLTRQNGRIREKLASSKGLAHDVLTPFIALTEFHCSELLHVVEECDARMELANSRWKLDNPITE
ncbi:hypothetical protein BGZ63DRAFT_379497 [Mariannaea sp. PMI_226]|nr:hypothetical protein BGZ63DRAFT_379497 [Mariannaea sp. PMI_226]